MDKYTVDLDQVLNDFEYSELTTEQHAPPPQQPPPSVSPHVPQKSYSSTKHSINNVFSSLNDYLSTEINDQQRSSTSYNWTPANEVKPLLSTTTTSGNVAGGTPVKEVPLESLIAQPISLKIENNGDSVLESPEILLNDLEVMKELQRSFTEALSISEEKKNQVVKEYQFSREEIDGKEFMEHEVQVSESLVNISDSIAIVSQEEECQTVLQKDCQTVLQKECQNVPQEEESQIVEEIKHEKKKENDEEEDEICEKYSEEENIIKENEDISKIEELDISRKETTENAKASCDKIGFHVEVADEEAAQYLADLEDEEDESFYDMPSPSDIARESLEHKNTDKPLEKDLPNTSNETKQNINTTNIEKEIKIEVTSIESHNTTSDVKNVETTGSIVRNTMICNDLQPNLSISTKSEVLDVLEVSQVNVDELEVAPSMEKHGKLQGGSEIVRTSNEHQIREPTESVGMQVEVVVVDKEENGDNLLENLRPSSLDIKDSKEQVVNIIGNPGSTPYNNIYVSKEVPPQITTPAVAQQSNTEPTIDAGEQDESESLTSSRSPTFSEASTDSVHSMESSFNQPPNQSSTKSTGFVQDEEGNLTSTLLNTDRIDGAGDDNQPGVSTISVTDDVHVQGLQGGSEEDVTMATASQPTIEDEEVYVDLDSITQPVDTQDVQENVHENENVTQHENEDTSWLGKRAPVWIPDADALCCQHCELRFTVIKRRHHCRACGLVLCAKCCSMRLRLEYLGVEARVCSRCYDALQRETDSGSGDSQHSTPQRDGGAADTGGGGDHPNPNNPMEYCSVVPPHQQVQAGSSAPSVMVPVGVLKRKGSSKKHNKSVMFCDGIRPGSDLTSLDQDFNHPETTARKASSSSGGKASKQKINKNLPLIDPVTQSFIPENENCLPPTVTSYKSDITYTECGNNANVVEMLQNETLTFAVQRNLHIHVRLIRMDCCVNKSAWCFSTEGLIAVGQDEIVILLEYIEGEAQVPKDVFHHLNNIYNSAVKGTTVTELGLSIHPTTNFLDSRNHAGFIFVRPSFQCLQNVLVPKEPYLVGVLVHRWETPWARIFPLRLVLRLGAEYRYYPVPLISTRHRDSVFVEIGHTIINLLADFRNFSYTLPNIRGLTIHMEEKSTTVAIPVNRYDQVMKSMSNSSEHILAFGGNFSAEADSHLVCIQDTQGSNENSYKTHAINIQNKPRKVTGASFIVFNGALKSSSGLTAKSSIVEDGLMIQIPPEHMVQVRESLRNMKNHVIQCGCVNAASDETVNIVWCSADVNFNVGVKSSVDGQSLSGVPSIRVHNGKDYTCNSGTRLVRWTEVFLLQSGEENARTQDPVDISKVAESISKATCQALVKYLDLLATNSFMKIGIRTTLHVDDVSYSAGSNGQKLPPIYMKSLDNELVPVLHRITSAGNVGDGTIVLELIFRILNV